jgi:hypothetical protein
MATLLKSARVWSEPTVPFRSLLSWIRLAVSRIKPIWNEFPVAVPDLADLSAFGLEVEATSKNFVRVVVRGVSTLFATPGFATLDRIELSASFTPVGAQPVRLELLPSSAHAAECRSFLSSSAVLAMKGEFAVSLRLRRSTGDEEVVLRKAYVPPRRALSPVQRSALVNSI